MVLVEVFHRIYIGNIHDANDVYKLISLNIGSVLSCIYCSNLDWCHKEIKDHKVFFKHDFLNCKKKLSRITGNISHEEIKEQVEEENWQQKKEDKTENHKEQQQEQQQQEQQQENEGNESDDAEHIGKDHPDYYFTNCAHYDFIVFPKEIKTAIANKAQTKYIVPLLDNIQNEITVDFCKPPRTEECKLPSTSSNISNKDETVNDLTTTAKEEKELEEKETKQKTEQSESKRDQIINMLKCEEATDNISTDDAEKNSEINALGYAELNENIKKERAIPLTNVYKIKHLYLDINDSYDENILNFVEKAHEFIDDALTENKNILIHCVAGISRCSTIILSYISKKNKKGINENYAAMTKKYPFAHPNEHFFQQLLLYERMNYNLNVSDE